MLYVLLPYCNISQSGYFTLREKNVHIATNFKIKCYAMHKCERSRFVNRLCTFNTFFWTLSYNLLIWNFSVHSCTFAHL